MLWNVYIFSVREFRILEPKCLKVCLSLFRVSHPDSNKYVCNEILYDTVNHHREFHNLRSDSHSANSKLLRYQDSYALNPFLFFFYFYYLFASAILDPTFLIFKICIRIQN